MITTCRCANAKSIGKHEWCLPVVAAPPTYVTSAVWIKRRRVLRPTAIQAEPEHVGGIDGNGHLQDAENVGHQCRKTPLKVMPAHICKTRLDARKP